MPGLVYGCSAIGNSDIIIPQVKQNPDRGTHLSERNFQTHSGKREIEFDRGRLEKSDNVRKLQK